ncbi:hypothetical protein [uncultured Sulfitobacter sp.]|uniref:hypothetical protein n=1 Tax=uncultured Sulfitobacter sp. TaxID=191468 RepID=UPI0026278A70|nr:hypothetical protein [uncultured Sulfitobacter sp.]
MQEQPEKVFKFDVSTGSTMIPVNVVRTLEYNIMNMRVGAHSIGSAKWFKALFKALKKLGYSELDDIKWKNGKPEFLRDQGNMLRELWYKSGKGNPKRRRRGEGPKFSRRIRKAIALLRDCPIDRVSFVTVVAGFARSKEEALQMVRDEGVRLERYIRNRFDRAVFVMFPEVDVVMAGKIPFYLMPQKGWKDDIDDAMQIYKVHFHGVMHVPAMGPKKVEHGFRYTKTNRKTKRYSGIQQVRSLPMYSELGQSSAVPDVLGVAGYANKNHFRPPVLLRMLEGFADWLWLTHKIYQDQSLVITGGTTDGVWEYCSYCEVHYRPEDSCDCAPVVVPIDFYGFDESEPEPVNPSSLTESQPDDQPGTSNITLNSGSPFPLLSWAKRVKKNISTVFSLAWNSMKSGFRSVFGLRPP